MYCGVESFFLLSFLFQRFQEDKESKKRYERGGERETEKERNHECSERLIIRGDSQPFRLGSLELRDTGRFQTLADYGQE